VLLATAARGAAAGAATHRDGRVHMGTVLELSVVAPSDEEARAAAEACFEVAARLDASLSTYADDSAVSRLNAAAGGAALPVDEDVRRILVDAKRLSALTGGAFDATVGPLVRLWTRAGREGRLPTPAALEAARALVGPDSVEITPAGVRLAREGMALDLGGLAKGWALDRMVERLHARGVERAFLSFGQSSIVALGAPPDAEAWRVLVGDARGGYAGVAGLVDARLSISGSFGRASVIEGRRLGHVIDPRSGWPVSRPAQAVVLAPTAAEAEAWSKALLVLAPEDALARLEAREGVEGMLALGDGTLRETAGFREATRFDALAAPTEPAGPEAAEAAGP
jgi:thiamine biosynthesis lipoprotein